MKLNIINETKALLFGCILNTNLKFPHIIIIKYHKYNHRRKQVHYTISIKDETTLFFAVAVPKHGEYEHLHYLISTNYLHKEQLILTVLEY
jgi:hypothetical protein